MKSVSQGGVWLKEDTLRWQVDPLAMCDWWLNECLVCLNEQNTKYFDINTGLTERRCKQTSSRCPLLVRLCLELVVLLGEDFVKLIWRSHIQGILTSKPEVIKAIRVTHRGASKPSHIWMLIPQTVSLLYDLFAWPFYHAWVNEFIAHMVHQHSLRPSNKLQCPLVPYEACCSLLALNLSHIALLCFYWMCFFKAVVACLSTISSNGSTSSFMEVYTGLHPSCYSLNNLSMLFHNKMATLMFLPYPQYLTKPGTFLLCSGWLRHHTVWL